MKVLVCGGRDYGATREERVALYKVLNSLDVDLIIEGGARGADALGKAWAEHHKIATRQFPADWDMHGKGAGHIRNAQMLAEGQPDLVVACPGGRGTENMVRLAEAAGVPVKHIVPKEAK